VTGKSLTEEEVRGSESSSADSHTADNAADSEDTLSFAQLQELITSGKVDQIPNNKVIPEELNVSEIGN